MHRAKNGESGRGADCYGKGADDVILRMPVGTVITDINSGQIIADLTHDGEKILLAKGGTGGLGNLHFKSSTNRTPRQCTPGEEGERRELQLELKVLADVGLLGMPNAGKSTFIRAVSAARPKVADYPFTTLHPNLGVVRVSEEKSFVIADIPGLIEGAAEGAGLGHQFLRHLARTRLLLHLVDIAPMYEGVDPVHEAHAILNELKKYDEALYNKPRWLVLNKLDLLQEEDRAEKVAAFLKAFGERHALLRHFRHQRRRLQGTDLRHHGAHQPDSRARAGRRHRKRARDRDRYSRPVSMKTVLTQSKRIVVKVGSSLVTNQGTGLDMDALGNWAQQIATLRTQGCEVVLVSSGAIAEGMQRLGWKKRPSAVHELQAAAAVGQMGLVQAYESCFRQHQLHAAQVLLTHADLADRERYLNARSTLRTLLNLGVIPIINENDTVVTDEIKFGDNDTLGALVANLIEADALVILTDQDGLYTADPRKDSSATLISEAQAGDAKLEMMAGGAGSHIGRGGMLTKVLAAKRAARSGAHTVIASGHERDVLPRLLQGESIGTLLTASSTVAGRTQTMAGRPSASQRQESRWMQAQYVPCVVEGKSLLPIGVTQVSGEFQRGAVVADSR